MKNYRAIFFWSFAFVGIALSLSRCAANPNAVQPPDPRTEKAKASDARVDDLRKVSLDTIEARIEVYQKSSVELKTRFGKANPQQRTALQSLDRNLLQAKQDLRDLKKANGSSFDRFRARLEAALTEMQKAIETMPTARENPEGA